MIFQLQNLDKYTASQLPNACRSCGWWQGYENGWPGPREAQAWADAAMEAFGSWGKLALADNRLLGVIQYGPSGLFPRAGNLACGPALKDAVVFTCGAVADDALAQVRKSLFTAVLADFRQRGIETVEAFCAEAEEEQDCRFFPPDFLRDCGFYPVRSARGLKLMRLELGGVQPAGPLKKSRRGLLERIKGRSATPAPVAMAQAIPACPLNCSPATQNSRDG